jgi:hypothetical protein
MASTPVEAIFIFRLDHSAEACHHGSPHVLSGPGARSCAIGHSGQHREVVSLALQLLGETL